MPNNANKLRLGYSPGRPAGKPNILTQSIRSGLLATWHQTGGVAGMVRWVEESSANRGQFYGYLCKLLPAELVEAQGNQGLTVIVQRQGDSKASEVIETKLLPEQPAE